MDIINNIKNILLTPNPLLLNILLIPFSFIENYLIIEIFILILNIKTDRKTKLTYVLLMSMISLINMFFIPAPFNIFINYFFLILLSYKIFKLSFIKSSLSILLSAILFSIIVSIFLKPFVSFMKITTEQLQTIPFYRISFIVLVYLFISLLISIIKLIKPNSIYVDNLDKKTKIILLINISLGLIAIIINYITLFYFVNSLPLYITILNSIPLILYFLVSLYSLKKTSKLATTTQELETTKEYNNTLCILHDNIRGFKHDFDNIVSTIGGFVKTKDIDGLAKYYDELSNDCQKVNELYALNPKLINNDGIYNLLTKKYYEADIKNIKFNITFLMNFNSLNMKIYDFSRILGILLDNAIEASSVSKEKIINLIFRDDQNNSRHLIIIENSYINKDIDINKIFNKGISEKENHLGFGLWEVNKILNKNRFANLFTTKNNKYFKQQLEIYYK